VKACAEAVEELRAARALLEAKNVEVKLQAEMLDLERKISRGLRDLRTMDASEKQLLREAIADKDRALDAKDAAIAALKKNRWTVWKFSKALALGAGAGIVLGAILTNR